MSSGALEQALLLNIDHRHRSIMYIMNLNLFPMTARGPTVGSLLRVSIYCQCEDITFITVVQALMDRWSGRGRRSFGQNYPPP